MSRFQDRVLKILGEGPRHPEDLYRDIWPNGRFAERNIGPSRGGPSRAACAVNWQLGRLRGLVVRDGQGAEPWRLTDDGKKALERLRNRIANEKWEGK